MSTQGSRPGANRCLLVRSGRQFDNQEVSALTALARTLAANLEKARLHEQRDRLLAADREMARATQLSDMAQAILSCARDLTGAVSTRLSLNGEACIRWTKTGSLRRKQRRRPARVISLRRKLHQQPRPGGWLGRSRQAHARFVLTRGRNGADRSGSAGRRRPGRCQEREAREHVRVDRLRQLAESVLGGGDFKELLDRVVAAAADALDVGGASLYLFDEAKGKLVIHSATGQEAILLDDRAEYAIGEGVTGGIALEGKTVIADSATALRQQPHWLGKYIGSDRPEPETFLGVPFTVFDRSAGNRARDRRSEVCRQAATSAAQPSFR